MNETDLPVVEMARPRWGNPATPGTLPGIAADALTRLGARGTTAVEPDAVTLPDPSLPAAARAALDAVVGPGHMSSDHHARVQHTRGYSTPDMLTIRAGDGSDAPDAVVYPSSHDEVVALLAACSEHRIAMVPFGGGTSAVGGLATERDGFVGVVAMDLGGLDRLVGLDAESRTATVQAGMRGPRVEELLREHGFTLGHFPQSYEGATIGGYAATRSAGQSSAGYGRFDEMVVGLVLATPAGTVELGTAPMSAAGPDLRQLVLGSEGTLGVITSVTVRVCPAPAHRVFEGWRFESFHAGTAALRVLAQEGPLPTVLRLSDEAETAVNLADPGGTLGGSPGGCLVVTGYEGERDEVVARRAAACEVLAAAGGTPLGEEPGEAWRVGRFRGPYLRDPLLDAGALVDTLETATFWSRLGGVKQAVTDAITGALSARGTPPLVMCHISHVYPTGASLYFTVLCAQSDDPLSQWDSAKQAAGDAILAAGATISHHHGVGTDHRRIYHAEVGPLAVEALRAVKRTLDPRGICNPAALV